jgi:RHS repeat-associated protein
VELADAARRCPAPRRAPPLGRLAVEDNTASSTFTLSPTATTAQANTTATAATTAQSWTYTLDGHAGWASRRKASTTTNYTRDVRDALTKIGATNVTLDARGAITNDGTLTVVYDALGFVKQATAAGTTRLYRRDALGRVVSETTGANITSFAYDGAARVLRKGPTGSIDLNVDGLGLDDHVATINGHARQFLHQDRLGSVFLVTDATGAAAEWTSYTAYGEATLRNPAGTALTASAVGAQFGWNGLPHDIALGLVDMRARLYRPTLGRFLSPDPLGLIDGTNRFAFVGASPLSFTDPLGLAARRDFLRDYIQERVVEFQKKRDEAYRLANDALSNPIKEVLAANVEAAWEMVTHPVQTVENIGYAITHPLETLENMWENRCNPNCLALPVNIIFAASTGGASATSTASSTAGRSLGLALKTKQRRLGPIRFAHGTSPESAVSVMQGLDAQLAARLTHGGTAVGDGFWAFQIGLPSNPGPGLELAYNFGKRHAGDGPGVVVIGELPGAVVKELYRRGALEVHVLSGIEQLLFRASGFDIFNSRVTWLGTLDPLRKTFTPR